MTRDNLFDELEYPDVDCDPQQVGQQGDARDLPLENNSIDLIFTSPPYWQKRDYGHENQIGQESTPEEYIETMMEAFDEWRGVLRDTGSVLLNIGDKYKYKSKVGVPWKLAEAARQRNWRVRSEIIWHKPNGMPSPANDRFNNRHEFIFQFTPRKSGCYFDKFGYKTVYDEPIDVWKVAHDRNETHLAPFPSELVERGLIAGCPPGVCTECGEPLRRKVKEDPTQINEDRPQSKRAMEKFDKSNLNEKHLEAIKSTGISDAGKGRIVQNSTGSNSKEVSELAYEAKEVLEGYFREFTFPPKSTVGWSSCDCDAETTPGVVLDPFAGSGTTLDVAKEMGFSAVGTDIEPSKELNRYSQPGLLDDN